MREFFIYILTNKSKTLYVGVTNDLVRRIQEHKDKRVKGFTKRYNLTKLAYYEIHATALEAISREKEIKGWLRCRKIKLIESVNPQWADLSEEF